MRININFLVGIIFFLWFGWDMEHTHTFGSWVILLIAILNLCVFFAGVIAELVVLMIQKYCDEEK